MPYSPPCNPGDRQLGDYCYPRPRVLVPIPLSDSFNMTIGGLESGLLPVVVNAMGKESHMVVKKSGDMVDLTLTSLQEEHVKAIKQELGFHID